jgi:hypothetical protein
MSATTDKREPPARRGVGIGLRLLAAIVALGAGVAALVVVILLVRGVLG